MAELLKDALPAILTCITNFHKQYGDLEALPETLANNEAYIDEILREVNKAFLNYDFRGVEEKFDYQNTSRSHNPMMRKEWTMRRLSKEGEYEIVMPTPFIHDGDGSTLIHEVTKYQDRYNNAFDKAFKKRLGVDKQPFTVRAGGHPGNVFERYMLGKAKGIEIDNNYFSTNGNFRGPSLYIYVSFSVREENIPIWLSLFQKSV
jgi:hypothetical protein